MLKKAVGVSITNEKRTLFYLQKKDNEYWIPQLRLKYCFFGGQIESSETESIALERELLEELNPDLAKIIYKNSKRVLSSYFINVLGENYKFSLYESVLHDKTMEKLSSLTVKEGEGFLIKRENILKIPFFPSLKDTLERYLSSLKED